MARLLLVDDDPNLLESARDILEESGYTVDIVSTVSAALAQLDAQPPDLVLVDFNLPDGNGVQLAGEIRRRRPTLRVILMTGEEKVDLSAASGAIVATLTKPVFPPDLLALLARLLKTP